MRSNVIAALAGAIVIAGLGAAALLPRLAGSGPAAAAAAGGVTIGGPFALVNGDGKTVTDRDFRGRFMLVYFGYTHCPDACPTTLNDMALALDKLSAAQRARVAPVFITVDPERDTPSMIGDYAGAFGKAFTGLTGSQAAISAAEAAYHVFAQKHPLAHGDYAMDHSSIIYVMGPDGGFVGVINAGTKPEEIAQRLQAFGV
jgi:protein SCO1/2